MSVHVSSDGRIRDCYAESPETCSVSDKHYGDSDEYYSNLLAERSSSSNNSYSEMFESLSKLGFSWRGVAQLLNVSVPVLQKWRKEGKAPEENQHKLANLLAGIEIIAPRVVHQDVASWFESPILRGVHITPISVWSAGLYVPILQYASGDIAAETVLNLFNSSWRTEYWSNFEAVRMEDGHISLLMRE